MCIERSLAQSRKMFPAPKHSRILQPTQKLARVHNHLPRIIRHRARLHHRPRSRISQVKHRSKIHIKPKRPAILPNHASMLAIKRAPARSKHLRRRRRRPNHLAKPVNCSTFKVHTSKKRSSHKLLAIPQKRRRLPNSAKIPSKKNPPRRLNLCEQGSDTRRHFRSVEADDKKLADLHRVATIEALVRLIDSTEPRT